MSFQVLTATCQVTTLLGRTCFQVFLIEGEWDVNRFSVTVHAMTLQSMQTHIHTQCRLHIHTARRGNIIIQNIQAAQMFKYKITVNLKHMNVKSELVRV